MKPAIVQRIRCALRLWWCRRRKGARHRDHRRDAGMTHELTWYECHSLALKAFEVSLQTSYMEVERELARLFLPLSEYEMTRVALAMAVLARPNFMGWIKQDDIEQMRLFLAVHWQPKMDEWQL
ncbi:hypothetical protein ACIA49_03550 [Kribbella sp. NPDC051587]|uniref:hypothetical protein n=1 Tax=Kribbella sp. NPDC051587 TaxID=3364119 RepID=UPI0037B6E2DC